MWDYCGMARNEAGLKKVLAEVPKLRERFWDEVSVPGTGDQFSQVLEHAGRVADFLEFAELLAKDALDRKESCGGHFREESQTADNEALRNDDKYSYVAAWEFAGVGKAPVLHKEPLEFENVHLTQRSYK
jgi:succinate dehydrogenase / fumarate reductase flavoprotein subunit